MKIAAIDAFPFRLPLRRDFKWASLQIALGGFVYVRVVTDDGLIGHGEATPLPDWGGDFGKPGGETQATVMSIIKNVIAPVLLGRDPTEIERAHMEMDRVLRGHSYARNAVDMALHDIWGKAVGQPVYRLLGGKVRESVQIAHMIGIMPNDQAVEEATAAVADGAGAFQIKGGLDPARDIDLIRKLREKLGARVFLRLDANQGYRRAKAAAGILEDLAAAALDMIEQPVDGRAEMAHATAQARVPVMADESCWDAPDALEIVRLRSADAVSIYLAKAGGIARARRVAAIAEAAQLPCDINGSIESGIGNAANLHFALACRPLTLPSVIPVSAPAGLHPNRVAGNYYTDDVIAEPFGFKNGCLLPLDRPGLGIDVVMEKLEKYRES
jgi:L-alanine-DL-glutamate epimerase-like enolase superfamily enzyme